MVFRNDIDLFGWGIGAWAVLFLTMWVLFYMYAFGVNYGRKFIKRKIFIKSPIFSKIVHYLLLFLTMAGLGIIGFSCAMWLETEEYTNFILIGLSIWVISFVRIFFQDMENEF